MSSNEIICLSSDDESEPPKNKNIVDVKSEKSESKKRPATDVTEEDVAKKKTLFSVSVKRSEPEDNGLEIVVEENFVKKSSTEKLNVEIISNSRNDKVIGYDKIFDGSSSQSTASNELLSKPQLIVKEKHPVELISGSQEVFAMFLSQCLQRDRSVQMQGVVAKLKRHYEQLDPVYSQSAEFIELLNVKREFLIKEDRYLYTHISDIDAEMKSRKKGRVKYIDTPSTSKDGEDENDKLKNKKLRGKIRKIEFAMKECEKRIKKLEEREIDFDDENNSSYIKLEKYKAKVAELYDKYCELTGEHEDAGRAYLRPKLLKVTKIPSVDQAIYSFMNRNLKTKNGKKILTADRLIFPDYIDVLNCIHACNVEQELGMNSKAESTLAEKAFTELGEYLKRVRQQDLFDTFSLMYENDDDPANKDLELAEKLQRNRQEGEENMQKILEEYAKRQDEADEIIEDDTDDDNDDEDEEDKETEINDDESVALMSEIDSDSEGKSDENEKTEKEFIVESEISENEFEKAPESEIIIQPKNVEAKLSNKSQMVIIPNDIDLDSLIEEIPLKLPQSADTINDSKSDEAKSDTTLIESEVISKESNLIKIIESDDLELEATENKKIPDPDSTTSEPQIIESEVEVISEKIEEILDGEEKPQPILKLRSFAKAPECWKNSQESKHVQIGRNIRQEKDIDDSIEIVDLESSTESVIVEIPSPKKSITMGLITTQGSGPSSTSTGRLVPLSSVTISKKLQPNPLATRPIIKTNFNKFTRIVRVAGKKSVIVEKLPSGSTSFVRQLPASTSRQFVHKPSTTLQVPVNTQFTPAVRTLSQKVLGHTTTPQIGHQSNNQIFKKVNIVRIPKPNNTTEFVNTNHRPVIRKEKEIIIKPLRLSNLTVPKQINTWKPSSSQTSNGSLQ